MIDYSVCTRSRRLAASRTGRERGWASRRQASLASCRRHIVRVRRAWSTVVCRCRRPACASRPWKTSSPLLVCSGRTTSSSTPASEVVLRIWDEPGARHRGETCTRGETPTRWNARIYRRREHWPCGCSSETESGAVTSG